MENSLKRAYENVLNTKDGQMVFEDLLTQFRINTSVYAFERNDSLSDLAFRDGQRNAGIYIFSILSMVNPTKASLINTNIMQAHNEAVKEAEQDKLKKESSNGEV